MTFRAVKNNFLGGVLTRKAQSRWDTEIYQKALATGKNMLANAQGGGIFRRSGFEWYDESLNTSQAPFISEFVFSDDDAYTLEWTDGKLRIRRSSGTIAATIDSPYSAAQAEACEYAQAGNTIFITHQKHPPQELIRHSDTVWSISDMNFIDGPWLGINETPNQVYTNTTNFIIGNTTVLTFESVAGINNHQGFQAGDVGRKIRVRAAGPTGKWCSGRITVVNSTVSVDIITERIGDGVSEGDDVSNGGGAAMDGGSTTGDTWSYNAGKDTNGDDVILTGDTYTDNEATTLWRLGAFGNVPGFPAAVSFYKGRLCFANTPTEPRAGWTSISGFPKDYAPSTGSSTTFPEHAVFFKLASGQGDSILWLRESARLLLGTSNAIRSVGAPDTRSVFGPGNVDQRIEVRPGSIAVSPITVASSTLYAGRYGKTIQDLFFSFESDGLVTADISRISDQVLHSPIRQMTFQHQPGDIAWIVTEDGSLTAVHFDKRERILAFMPQDVTGTVHSITVVPDNVAKRDVLHISVERDINSVSRYYLERLGKDFDLDDDDLLEDAFLR